MVSSGEPTHADLDGGWILPAPAARVPVHTRSILCRSFRRDDGLMDIDGRFIDTRPFEYESEFRGMCTAGAALHHMQLRLTVDSTRHIHALVSAMHATPYAGCADVNPNFQRLVGVSLGRGFRKILREKVGSSEGCTHIIALLDVMAAAAVQTFTSAGYAALKPGQPKPARIFRIEQLVDTCYSYRTGSQVLQQMKDRSAQAERDSQNG